MTGSASSPQPHRSRGFTLIELLIAVVVLGVVLALALPSFIDAIRKSRRSEAYSALGAVQLKQERWRTNNPIYAFDLTGAWPDTGLALADQTPGKHYNIRIASPVAASSPGADRNYEITATPVAGSSQVKDGDCAQLGVKMEAGNLKYGSAADGGTLAYATNNKCWSK